METVRQVKYGSLFLLVESGPIRSEPCRLPGCLGHGNVKWATHTHTHTNLSHPISEGESLRASSIRLRAIKQSLPSCGAKEDDTLQLPKILTRSHHYSNKDMKMGVHLERCTHSVEVASSGSVLTADWGTTSSPRAGQGMSVVGVAR